MGAIATQYPSDYTPKDYQQILWASKNKASLVLLINTLLAKGKSNEKLALHAKLSNMTGRSILTRCLENKPALTELLLKLDADPEQTNLAGKKPIDLLKLHNHGIFDTLELSIAKRLTQLLQTHSQPGLEQDGPMNYQI